MMDCGKWDMWMEQLLYHTIWSVHSCRRVPCNSSPGFIPPFSLFVYFARCIPVWEPPCGARPSTATSMSLFHNLVHSSVFHPGRRWFSFRTHSLLTVFYCSPWTPRHCFKRSFISVLGSFVLRNKRFEADVASRGVLKITRQDLWKSSLTMMRSLNAHLGIIQLLKTMTKGENGFLKEQRLH